ncbi:MAG: hypothetical protein HZA18_05885 [Nitrospirae bacterium]|nr:hypothetical protein [Nitrospirota bacterium]
MRKIMISLLTAGAVALVAGQAIAGLTNVKGEFTENHAYKGNFIGGTTTTLATEVGGNHYKKTDFVENGSHGWQLSSAILKSVAGDTEGFKADDSYGFITGKNPFGSIGLLDTDFPIGAPAYTAPCPKFVGTSTNASTDPSAGPQWTCQANTYATDPQTEDNANEWDGTVLDELYQTVGAQDSRLDHAFTEPGENLVDDEIRSLDQNLSILFYNGQRGEINLGATTILQAGGDYKSSTRHFNIDQTLDQDVADYAVIWTSSASNTHFKGPKDETMGIYGKLTQIFQLAAPVSSHEGCASGGAYKQSDSKTTTAACTSYVSDTGNTGSAVGEGVHGFPTDNLNAFIIDQWVVSDVWDWHHKADDDPTYMAAYGGPDKFAGMGMKQGYSSWFRDGTSKDFNYKYGYQGGHGTIDKTVNLGTQASHPDP